MPLVRLLPLSVVLALSLVDCVWNYQSVVVSVRLRDGSGLTTLAMSLVPVVLARASLYVPLELTLFVLAGLCWYCWLYLTADRLGGISAVQFPSVWLLALRLPVLLLHPGLLYLTADRLGGISALQFPSIWLIAVL